MSQLPMDWHGEPSFHDRDHVLETPRQEPARVRANAKASAQERAILTWLKGPRLEWARAHGESERVTPWDVADAFPALPITSARRALTNLAKRGELVHHPRDRRQAGPYGQTSGTWGLP